MDEVENPVLGRVHPGDKSRPGYRTLGRIGRAESAHSALSGKLEKIRHGALVHELSQQHRVHPVETENKHLGRFLGAAATDQERDEKSAEQKYALNPLSYLP